MLSSNNLTELSDLDVLGKFPRLTQLVLMDNPVTKKEVRFVLWTMGNLAQGKCDEKSLTCGVQHYRYWVIWRCPTVRFLDYQKVRQAEREKAEAVFGTAEEPTELATKVRILATPRSSA